MMMMQSGQPQASGPSSQRQQLQQQQASPSSASPLLLTREELEESQRKVLIDQLWALARKRLIDPPGRLQKLRNHSHGFLAKKSDEELANAIYTEWLGDYKTKPLHDLMIALEFNRQREERGNPKNSLAALSSVNGRPLNGPFSRLSPTTMYRRGDVDMDDDGGGRYVHSLRPSSTDGAMKPVAAVAREDADAMNLSVAMSRSLHQLGNLKKPKPRLPSQ